FGAYFVYSGLMHLARWRAMVGYTKAVGVPFPSVSNFLAAALLLFGGLSVAVGILLPLGAGALTLFLLAAAILVHHFWDLKEPMMAGNQRAHFLKNVALASAVLVVAGLGPGPWSLG
ncbi:MAG: DoxX family protein, partial [Chloroflexi bacterium]|nr:DoxX family protein [Chloroflexota bacterium]